MCMVKYSIKLIIIVLNTDYLAHLDQVISVACHIRQGGV